MEEFARDAQLKNIASEFAHAPSAGLRAVDHGHVLWQEQAYERALALIDASLDDPKWQDQTLLYELRDAVAALFAEHSNPALCRLVMSYVLDRAEFENRR